MAKKIAFVAADGGAYETLLPVYRVLTREKHEVIWVTEDGTLTLEKLIKKRARKKVFLPQHGHYRISPKDFDVVVAGVSGLGPGIELLYAEQAKVCGIPVVKIVDFWGSGMPHEKGFAPDLLCVLDEGSVDYEERMRGMLRRNIRVTGDPKMDKLTKVNVSPKARSCCRRELLLDTPFIILVGPSSHERVMEFFPDILSALSGTPMILGLLWHPMHKAQTVKRYGYDPEGKEKEVSITVDCYAAVRRHRVLVLADHFLRSRLTLPQLYLAADAVVGSTSTETIVSCYMRRPTLNVIYPGGKNQELLHMREISALPTVQCGAAFLAETKEAVMESIHTLLYSVEEIERQRTAQEQHYRLDGKSTLRVVNAIKELL